MLSIDPKATRVVLIGTSQFPRDPKYLRPLPGVRANVRDLRRIFAARQIIGIPRGNIVTILDEPKPYIVLEKLAYASEKAEDTFIVYYAGHGVISLRSRQLYLTTKDTTFINVDQNGLSFEKIREEIEASIAIKKILILDCCFSGKALHFLGAEVSLLQSNIDIEGTYAIASAPANEPAMAPPGERYTAFSGELVQVLREGIDNEKEVITLREIYKYITIQCKQRKLPRPQQANFQNADEIAIAYNRKTKKKRKQEKSLNRQVEVVRKLKNILRSLRRLKGLRGLKNLYYGKRKRILIGSFTLFFILAIYQTFQTFPVLQNFTTDRIPILSPLPGKFQVGDKIRVKEGVNDIEGVKPGDIGTVNQISGDTLEVKFLSGITELVSSEVVEKVP